MPGPGLSEGSGGGGCLLEGCDLRRELEAVLRLSLVKGYYPRAVACLLGRWFSCPEAGIAKLL